MTCVCRGGVSSFRHKQNIKATICQNTKCDSGFMVVKMYFFQMPVKARILLSYNRGFLPFQQFCLHFLFLILLQVGKYHKFNLSINYETLRY